MTDTLRKIVTSERLDKISTPRGDGRSMTSLSPTNVGVSYGRPANLNVDNSGANWFGPLQPLRPLAPPEVAGRAWDFAPGYNLQTNPRVGEGVDFATLRAMADALPQLRLIVERRKDQMSRMQWVVRARHDGPGKRPKAAQLSPATRSLIRDVESFFQRPSNDFGWRDWLRVLTEDLLVIDAPSLYCERNGLGELMGLRPLDGATIKRVVDDWGGTPRPFIWDGSTFEWLGQQVTPANFDQLGFVIRGDLVYPPAYQQILKGLPAVNYTALGLLYKPLNRRNGRVFGHSPVEQVLSTVNIALRRSQSQLEYFREGNMPEGLYSLPETWTPDQVQRYQDYFDNMFVGNLGARRQLKFMAGGGKSSYVPLKEPPLKSELDEWLVRIICFAFSYPPSAFVELSNRSIAEEHQRTAEREGLEPLKAWVSDLANEIISDELDPSGTIEFAFVEEGEIDPEKQAKILSTLVSGGILTANEARERLGEELNPSPAANELMIRTPTGDAPIEGGAKPKEENAK
jgi:hypothetical protein